MNTLWKVAAVTLVATSVAGCFSRTTTTREVVHEQPVVQQQPTIVERTTVVPQEPRIIERDRVVVVPPPG